MAQVDIREGGAIPEKQLRELFAALGWDDLVGLLPDLLLNSTFVVSAWDGARLVGLSRVVSDRVYISTLQQVGVHPTTSDMAWGPIWSAAASIGSRRRNSS